MSEVAPHILVIDDDAEIGALLTRYFVGHGYRVTVAGDGAQGGPAGVVTSCTYLGDKCEYAVDLAGIPVQIAKTNPQSGDRLAPGTKVFVQLPATGLQLLPGHSS